MACVMFSALLKVPSAFLTSYRFANLVVIKLCFLINDLLMKFVVAPESISATACAFFPNTHSVTGSLKDEFLLRATLINLDLVSTLSTSTVDSDLGIFELSTCRMQELSTCP